MLRSIRQTARVARMIVAASAMVVLLVPFDIFDSIGSFFGGLWDGTIGAAKAVFGAIKAVYNFIVTIGDHVGAAFTTVYNGLGAFGESIIGFANGAAASLGHILTYSIPHFFESAGAGLAHGITGLLHTVVNAAVSTVKSWVNGLIKLANKAIGAAANLAKSALAPLATVYNWFTTTARDAIDLLTHPDKLVTWILGHLLVPLVQAIVSGGEAIAKTLWRWLLSHFKSVLGELESIIASIL